MTQKIFISLFALTSAVMLGCTKNKFRDAELEDPTGKAIVKIGYFSADSTERSVQLYIDNNAVSNNFLSHSAFPGGGYNTKGASDNGFLAIDPTKGSAEFKFVTANTGSSVISKVLFTVSAPIYGNTQQIVFITDTAANTTAYTVKTETERPDSGFVKMQFTNAIPNAGPVDFYYADSLVASNVDYKAVVDFIRLPLKASPSLKAVRAGMPNIAANFVTPTPYPFTGIGNQRIYTVVCRGYRGITDATKDAQRYPKVSLVIVK